MKAVKENKVYTVDGESAKVYRNQGFDIYSEDGELLEYGAGKTVSYEEYMAVKTQLEESKGQQGDLDATQIEVLNILKTFASEHGIELGKANTVAGVVKKIKEYTQEGGR